MGFETPVLPLHRAPYVAADDDFGYSGRLRAWIIRISPADIRNPVIVKKTLLPTLWVSSAVLALSYLVIEADPSPIFAEYLPLLAGHKDIVHRIVGLCIFGMASFSYSLTANVTIAGFQSEGFHPLVAALLLFGCEVLFDPISFTIMERLNIILPLFVNVGISYAVLSGMGYQKI
ncbi:hypothetical protein K402DRAFT_400257 [Aulographum hederae CBS 113979]|uniref:Uncharacterized protein n=1 Tax=Aulographum hederae CBS 113979 TaxID=1176131 RepID=A0A6G1HEM6_9PEZI|nr:hypothetical protein K402DRAFT_400257 [Aulographum hederae CBS 113979]